METIIEYEGEVILLTTKHSSSCYGMPVAIIKGECYGQNDLMPWLASDPLGWMVQTVRITVMDRAYRLGMRDNPVIDRFLGE